MNQVGIYEQLITQLIASRIDRERFYVGERKLNSIEASTWLSRFVSHILEYAIESVPVSDDRLQQQIALSLLYQASHEQSLVLQLFYQLQHHQRLIIE